MVKTLESRKESDVIKPLYSRNNLLVINFLMLFISNKNFNVTSYTLTKLIYKILIELGRFFITYYQFHLFYKLCVSMVVELIVLDVYLSIIGVMVVNITVSKINID